MGMGLLQLTLEPCAAQLSMCCNNPTIYEASVITEMMVSSLHCLSVITQSGNLARCNSGVVACLHFESCFVQST